jgi:cytochrome b561/polyisoprenoid-binding protein YceI
MLDHRQSGPGETSRGYGAVSRALHWLTALLILTELPLGLYANALPFSTGPELARAAYFFSLHKTLGVTIFFVAIMRIVWAMSHPGPGALHPERSVENFVAATVHWCLYIALVLVPLTGWIAHAASAGYAPIWWPFGQSLPLVPKDEGIVHLFASLHGVFTKVLAISILLHVAGALKHTLLDRDATVARMWSGGHAKNTHQTTQRRFGPVLAAFAAFGVAIMMGSSLSQLSRTESVVAPASDLPTVSSGWVVSDGTLELSIIQFGGIVTGSFSDWSAAIQFDQASGRGSVDVEIAIDSLTLGSVTANALGADFFDAANFPTATFSAGIEREGGTYHARGTLALKGRVVPIDLPFSLEVSGRTATVSGSTELDRRDYNIGANLTDEDSIGFPVIVSIELVALQSG